MLTISSMYVSPELKVGMKAPSLQAARWVKGNKPNSLSDGRFHVVEFWATWCAPCRESMPILSQLTKRYAGKVEVAGISVWENRHKGQSSDPLPTVKSFIVRQGTRMSYDVGADSTDETIANSWLRASGSDFIPTAFIVDRVGKIVWKGNAYDLEPALNAAVANARNPDRSVVLNQVRVKKLLSRLEAAASQGDLSQVLEFRKTIPYSESFEKTFELLYKRNPAMARQFAEALIQDPSTGMWQLLDLVWFLTGSNQVGATRDDLALATRMAQAAEKRADPSDESRLVCLQYLTDAYAKAGDFSNAVVTQQRQIDIMISSRTKDYSKDLKDAEKLLATYQSNH